MASMKKSIKSFLAGSLILLLLFTMGCSDFLNKVPQGNLTQQDFPVTADQALLATNAIYNNLRNWYFSFGGYPILDIMSDDATKGSNPQDQAANLNPYNNFTITPTQDGLDRWWSALFQGVKYANVVIEKVPVINMDENLKNKYVGEAKFLRALFYFDLVRAWGGMPIITSTTPDLKVPRSTKEETYQFIIDDLLFAVDNLPDKTSLQPADFGHATRQAAQALLAKVYLFQGDFVNAAQYATDVINSQMFSLDPDFGHTFSVDGQFNSESVFEVGALGLDGFENGGNQYGNTQGVRGSPNKGWGFNRPSVDLINSFEPGDPRKEATIIFLGEVIDGVTILGDGSTPDITYADPPYNTIVAESECYSQKVWTPTSSNAEGWGCNRRLIRYADVLLMAAEALNENGNPTQALIYLNEIRARARGGDNTILPDITETDKTVLRNLILHERRSELAMESERFWDLVRTGKAVEVLGPLGFVAGKDELLPIPQTQIDLSQGSMEQNPNW
jgi:hypothetical protein